MTYQDKAKRQTAVFSVKTNPAYALMVKARAEERDKQPAVFVRDALVWYMAHLDELDQRERDMRSTNDSVWSALQMRVGNQ